MNPLPRQVFISSDDMKPSKHRHWYVPGVLVHWPPSQISGLSSHSSISEDRKQGGKSKMKWEQTNWREHIEMLLGHIYLSYTRRNTEQNQSIWCTFTSSLINHQGQLRIDFVQRVKFMLRSDGVIFSSSSE